MDTPAPQAFGYFDQVVVVTQGQVTFYGTPQQGKDVLAHIGSEVPATYALGGALWFKCAKVRDCF